MYKLMLLALLSSCCISLPKEQQTKDILPSPSLEVSAQGFPRGQWPRACWWTMFNAPELDALMMIALEHNPSLQSVRRKIDQARQESIVVRSKLFPLVFFDASDSKLWASHNGLFRALNPTFPISANLVDLSVGFTYEFDFWGKNANLFSASLGRARAEVAEGAQVTLMTTTLLAQSYFAYKTNLVRKSLYEQLLQVRSDALRVAKLLREKALYSKFEPLLYEENQLEAKKLVDGIVQELAIDKHLINALIGRGPDECLSINDLLPPLPEKISVPCNVSSDLLARRPDLMAQIWRAQAIAHEVGAAMADFYPDVNLAGFVGLESVLYSTLFQSSSFNAGLTPAIHLPIFTAGAIQANICAQRAAFDAAIFSYNELILQSVSEVSDLLATAKALYQQKLEQDQIVRYAKERYDLTVLLRRKGLGNILDDYAYLEALIQKELDDVQLLYNQYLISVKLIKALGGGYE